MIVNTHNAESCAFRSQPDAVATSGAFDRFEQLIVATEGLELRGSWINRPSHEGFVLVEASGAHVIDDAIVESGLIGRTHTRVVSVLPTADVEVNLD
jgi:hypothetical protein